MMEIRSAEIMNWRERDKRSMAVMKRLMFPVFLVTALAGRAFSDSSGKARRRVALQWVDGAGELHYETLSAELSQAYLVEGELAAHAVLQAG